MARVMSAIQISRSLPSSQGFMCREERLGLLEEVFPKLSKLQQDRTTEDNEWNCPEEERPRPRSLNPSALDRRKGSALRTSRYAKVFATPPAYKAPCNCCCRFRRLMLTCVHN